MSDHNYCRVQLLSPAAPIIVVLFPGLEITRVGGQLTIEPKMADFDRIGLTIDKYE